MNKISRLKNPPTNNQIEFAARLKNKRIESGLSLQEVAEKIGISKVTLSRYESLDIVNIPSDKIEELAIIYGTTPAYLMGWENKSVITAPSFEYRNYPVGIAAGALEEIDAMDNVPMVSVPDAWLGKYARNRDIVFMHVNGESMNKIIQNGATIAVLMNIDLDSIHNGDVVVAQNCHGEYTVKHFYDDEENNRFILRPDSSDPSFTDMIFNYDDASDMKIFGKVVIYSVYL
jgi:repressor LexA